jgi:HEPN domain-containing protein
MLHDPIKAADTRAWLEKAHMDLRSAQVDLDASPPIIGDALFHCQQAVEKTIKALLTWHDQPFRKTHDLAVLGAQLAELEPEMDDLLKDAAPLTEYAWKFRYPGEACEPPEAEAVTAAELARAVIEAVTNRVPTEARPRS